jgi:hypothetical protein
MNASTDSPIKDRRNMSIAVAASAVMKIFVPYELFWRAPPLRRASRAGPPKVVAGSRFPSKKNLKSGTQLRFYNDCDCDSLFTQAEKAALRKLQQTKSV